MGINILVATGNLGKDATQRFTHNGDSVVSFSLPITSGYGKNQITTWLNCSLWGKRGESVLPYLKKGTQVGVQGEFCARPYTDKEGHEKTSLDLRISDLSLLGSKPSSESHTESNEQRMAFHQDEDDMDSIPF